MSQSLRQRLLWSFYVPSVLIATAQSMLIPVLPVYGGELTSSYILIGVLLAASAIGRTIGDLPSGNLMRQVGVKQTMVIGNLIIILSMALLFFAQDIWTATGLLIISGVGHAFYNISRHTYIAATVPNHIRGRAIGLLGGVFRIGKFVGPVIGGWIGGTFALQTTFPVYTAMIVLTAWFVWQFMESPPLVKRKQEESKSPLLLQTLHENRGVLGWSSVGQIAAQLTRNGWQFLIPLYAADVLGLPVQTIGLVVGIGAAFDALFFYTSGIVMDRFGRKWAIVPSFAVQGVCIALIVLTNDAIGLTVVASLIGLANAFSSGTMMTLGSDLAPPDVRGEFLSIWRLIGDLGFVAGPLVVGGIAQALTLNLSVLAIAGTGLGTALLFGQFVPETLDRRRKIPQVEQKEGVA